MKLGLFASALVFACCHSLAADAAEKLIKAKPAEGVEIGIPKGWKACEPRFDEKLGSADDPLKLFATICGPTQSNASIRLAVFWPVPLKTATIYVMHADKSSIDAATIKSLTAAMLQQATTSVCADWVKTVAEAGNKLDSCIVRSDELDGKPALVTTVIQTPKKEGALGQSVTEMWEVPYENGLIQFNITWAKVVEQAVMPTLDRIKKSVDID
jgi:hypothetical protein